MSNLLRLITKIQSNRIEISLNENIRLEPFGNLKLNINFKAFLPQSLEVTKHTDYESSKVLGKMCGPAIDLAAILVQNWTDIELNLSKGMNILTIAFDQCDNTVIVGKARPEFYMDKLFHNYILGREYVDTQNFTRLILSALNFTQGGIPKDLKSLAEKQEHITSLLEKSNIGINELKLSKTGSPKLEYLKNRQNLNRIMLLQLLQKHVQLSNNDLIKIQESCPFLSNLKEKSMNGKTEKYPVYNKVLYKVELVMGTKIYKLALPTNFAYTILFNSHNVQSNHLSAQAHSEIFGANFYVKDCLN